LGGFVVVPEGFEPSFQSP